MSEPENLRQIIAAELAKAQPDWHLIERLSAGEVDANLNSVRFSVDAGHIQRLGLELVAKQETALAELIKNAYDADASRVIVTFQNHNKPGGQLRIDDNGLGMTLEDVRDSWMRLSTSRKQAQPISPRYQRLRAGRKGIGRFSVQRLGKTLTMETEVAGSAMGLRVSFDWDSHYGSGQNLNDIFNQVEEYQKPLEREGTRLLIGELRETWSEAALNRVWKMILSLQTPFVALAEGGSTLAEYTDPGFELQLNGESSTRRKTTLGIESGFLQHALATVTGGVGSDGAAIVRLVSNRLGLDESYTLEEKFHLTGPFNFTARYFIYFPDVLSGLSMPLAVKMGTEYGGIRLYRNGFRVAPYGERTDDWLRLDRDTSRRTIIVPANNINFFGQVSLSRAENPNFEETSSREGLIENDAFEELRTIVRDLLEWAVLRVAAVRGRKQTAGQKGFVSTARPRKPSEIIEKLYTEIATPPVLEAPSANLESQHSLFDPQDTLVQPDNVAAPQLPTKLPEVVAAMLKQASEEAKLWEADVAQREAAALQYEEMLRILASLGLSISVFGHEIKGIRGSVAAHLDVLSKQVAVLSMTSKNDLDATIEEFKGVTGRMFDIGGYIAGLMSSTESRELRPLSLKGVIERFRKQFAQYLERQTIDFESEVVPAHLRTTEMHASELDSVLLNFMTNSIRSMKAAKVSPRRIRVRAWKDDEFVVISFEDNGLGIREENKDRIFDAFFTTVGNVDSDDGLAGPGTGLGLKIVSDIATSYGGEVTVEPASEGYSCNIEFRVLAYSEKG